MLDRRRQARLTPNALRVVGIARQRRRDDLDRDSAAELGLLGQIHHPMPPLPSTPSVRYPAKIVPILIAAAMTPTRA